MKKNLLVVGVLLTLSVAASAADKQKKFNLTVEPPDSTIKIISGSDLNEQQYRSPASITAAVPQDPGLAKKAVIEITRDRYKPAIIALRNIRDGETLKVRLEKEVRTRLKFMMISPLQSDEIRIKDDRVSIGFKIDEKQMLMSLRNNTSRVIRVLWERALYTDMDKKTHRLMHPGIQYEDRNRSYPFQTVMPYQTIEQPVIPADSVSFDRNKNALERGPLFSIEKAAGLKGKVFDVLIPVDIDTKVVTYAFKIKVVGTVKE
jgi:hypothetical protein